MKKFEPRRIHSVGTSLTDAEHKRLLRCAKRLKLNRAQTVRAFLNTAMEACLKPTILAVALALAVTSAHAQSPTPAERAYQQTVAELTQAWVGARTALNGVQDQLTAANNEIVSLKAKLPRQMPVPSPSSVGAPTPPTDQATGAP